MMQSSIFDNIETQVKSQINEIFLNFDSLEPQDTVEIKKRLGEIEGLDHFVHIGENIERLKDGESGARWSIYLGVPFLVGSGLTYLMNNFKLNELSVGLGALGLLALLGYCINKSEYVKPATDNIGVGLSYVFGEESIGSENGYNRGVQAAQNIYSHLNRYTHLIEEINPDQLHF